MRGALQVLRKAQVWQKQSLWLYVFVGMVRRIQNVQAMMTLSYVSDTRNQKSQVEEMARYFFRTAKVVGES